MAHHIDLDDIQGNIIRGYGRYSFPKARYFFLHIEDASAGRKFINKVTHKITTAAHWNSDKPLVTLNIGFTFTGLMQLSLPIRTLQAMPNDFIEGMKARAFILGDDTNYSLDNDKWCAHWDPIWKENRTENNKNNKNNVHIWISINAQVHEGTDEAVPALEEQTEWLRNVCEELQQKVRILTTNGQKGNEEYQSASAIFDTLPNGLKVPTAKEHFGFTDGIGNPVFEGQFPEEVMKKRVIGSGKWMTKSQGWQPLATGEFILGYPDESQELPPTTVPWNFTRNGTFMIYRKLHENVDTFAEVIAEEAKNYAEIMNIDIEQAETTLKAKVVGRWPDGVPLSLVPTYQDWIAFKKEKGFDNPNPLEAAISFRNYYFSDEPANFKYGDDMQGIKCPVTSHLRRANPRDYLDPHNKSKGNNADATTQLSNRRRILRRGLPYGLPELGKGNNQTEQGVIFMVVCTSIFRQFEFVQQQWMEYALDFNAGNNTCPLIGNHIKHKNHIVPSDPTSKKMPYVMSDLKNFVETRGGDYFFIPSISALQMMAMGIIDPT